MCQVLEKPLQFLCLWDLLPMCGYIMFTGSCLKLSRTVCSSGSVSSTLIGSRVSERNYSLPTVEIKPRTFCIQSVC